MHPFAAAALMLSGSFILVAPYAYNAWMLHYMLGNVPDDVVIDFRPAAFSSLMEPYNASCLIAGVLMIAVAIAGSFYYMKLRLEGERRAQEVAVAAQNANQHQ